MPAAGARRHRGAWRDIDGRILTFFGRCFTGDVDELVTLLAPSSHEVRDAFVVVRFEGECVTYWPAAA